MGDASLLKRVADKFQAKSRQTLEQLLGGYKAGDAAATARFAHAMKGAASNLSAVKLATIAERIEDLGQAGDLAAAEDAVRQLSDEFERCIRELPTLGTETANPRIPEQTAGVKT